uniref:Uncharacterized protein n=1 Tax=Elizabethkingia anophelis TaxID=1117645 RepID=A0A455ZF98_9FLAO|nr:TPA_exp: hypothetical protein [Elizabethkingia anophelis]
MSINELGSVTGDHSFQRIQMQVNTSGIFFTTDTFFRFLIPPFSIPFAFCGSFL